MGKRIAGDCSRKRRFCFTQNPAKAAWYAAHRSRRFARRFLQTDPSSPSTSDSLWRSRRREGSIDRCDDEFNPR